MGSKKYPSIMANQCMSRNRDNAAFGKEDRIKVAESCRLQPGEDRKCSVALKKGIKKEDIGMLEHVLFFRFLTLV